MRKSSNQNGKENDYICIAILQKKLKIIKMADSKGMVEGLKTKFHKDVKIPIRAGMQFGSKDYKIRTIGYDVFRHYFDTKEMDMQVGRQRIKRVLNK
jgi:hypothetical protein